MNHVGRNMVMEISKELLKCIDDLETIKQKLLDDKYLFDTYYACDVFTSIDNSQRNACVAQLNKNIQMLKGLSHEIQKIIKYEYASITPWDSDISF